MGCTQPKTTIASLHNKNNQNVSNTPTLNNSLEHLQLAPSNQQAQYAKQSHLITQQNHLNIQQLSPLQPQNSLSQKYNILNPQGTQPQSPNNKNNNSHINVITFGANPNNLQKERAVSNIPNAEAPIVTQSNQQSRISQNQAGVKPQLQHIETINMAKGSSSKIYQKQTEKNPISELMEGILLQMPSKIATSFIPSNIDDGFPSFKELDRIQMEARIKNNQSLVEQDEEIHQQIDYQFKIQQINLNFQIEIK